MLPRRVSFSQRGICVEPAEGPSLSVLPLVADATVRIVAVMPRPADLTPADTSSSVAPGLAAALRRDHRLVDEVVVEQRPDAAAIAAIRDRARTADLVVIGTIDGHRQPSRNP